MVPPRGAITRSAAPPRGPRRVGHAKERAGEDGAAGDVQRSALLIERRGVARLGGAERRERVERVGLRVRVGAMTPQDTGLQVLHALVHELLLDLVAARL